MVGDLEPAFNTQLFSSLGYRWPPRGCSIYLQTLTVSLSSNIWTLNMWTEIAEHIVKVTKSVFCNQRSVSGVVSTKVMLSLATLAPTSSSSTKLPLLPCLRLRHRDYSNAGNGCYPSSQTSLLGHSSWVGHCLWSWSGWAVGIQAWEKMGRSGSNALTHQQQSFGWKQNNTIGSPQINTWTADWVELYPTPAGYQFQRFTGEGIFLNRKVTSGYPSTAGTPASTSLVTAICGVGMQLYCVRWTSDFDPAVYFGDREVDVAMTELFGGFPRFYHGYNEVFPLTQATSSGEHSITSITSLITSTYSVVATAHGPTEWLNRF